MEGFGKKGEERDRERAVSGSGEERTIEVNAYASHALNQERHLPWVLILCSRQTATIPSPSRPFLARGRNTNTSAIISWDRAQPSRRSGVARHAFDFIVPKLTYFSQ
jgi:hypothetical protein